jgi:hypothetical protein
MRITIACPVSMVSDANHLAMILAFGPADALTYNGGTWRDADGNLYSAASGIIGTQFLGLATSALARPSWDTDNVVNMTGAARAQAAVALIQDGASPLASPTQITAILGDDGLAALAVMGLVPVETTP